MDSRLTVRLLLDDDGLLTVQTDAANCGFIGRTQVYTTYADLEQWSSGLRAMLRTREGEAHLVGVDD